MKSIEILSILGGDKKINWNVFHYEGVYENSKEWLTKLFGKDAVMKERVKLSTAKVFVVDKVLSSINSTAPAADAVVVEMGINELRILWVYNIDD